MLIVEDDVTCAETTARFLRMNGYTVALAASGENGLREAETVMPDLVLLDQRLGDGMTGLECLRALRRTARARNAARTDRAPQPAVVLITADWELEEDEVRELDAFLLNKPCDADQILAGRGQS